MGSTITRVAVLGAGTMGAGIAAHCANVGLQVSLLDIAPDKLTPEEEKRGLPLEHPAVRNRIVKAGYDRMAKSRPASLANAAAANQIRVGNFADNFDWLREADWIVEVIIERLGPKQALMARIEEIRKPGSYRHVEYLRHPAQPDRGGARQRLQAALPGHALLQPAALPETAGGHPDRRDRPGGGCHDQGFRREHAG